MSAGCDSSTHPESRAPDPDVGRVVDLFDQTHIVETPGQAGYESPVALAFEESFETDTPAGWQVSTTRKGSAVPPPRMTAAVFRTGSRSLQIGSTQGPPDTFPHLLRFVAVEPDTTYRLRAAVRTRDLEPRGREALGATVEIFEWDRPGAGQPRAHHGQLPRERGTSEGWRELDYVFRTSPETHALTLSLVAAHGPPPAWPGSMTCLLRNCPTPEVGYEENVTAQRPEASLISCYAWFP